MELRSSLPFRLCRRFKLTSPGIATGAILDPLGKIDVRRRCPYNGGMSVGDSIGRTTYIGHLAGMYRQEKSEFTGSDSFLVQDCPASLFYPAHVRNRELIAAAALRFNSTIECTIEPEISRMVQQVLKAILPELVVDCMSKSEFVSFVHSNVSQLKGAAGAGYSKFKNKLTFLLLVTPETFYDCIMSMVFIDKPWIASSCFKDELRLVVDGYVKDPRSFVSSTLHDYCTGLILFHKLFEKLNDCREWMSVIGVNMFTEWGLLYQRTRQRQLHLGLPDKYACSDISGSDKYQKHAIRRIFIEVLQVPDHLRAIFDDYMDHLESRIVVDQNGFAFLVTDGLDSGKFVTLHFNTLYSLVCLIILLIKQCVDFASILVWPALIGGDDNLTNWPFAQSYYDCWQQHIYPITGQKVSNENGQEGDTNDPPEVVPLEQAQIYSMSFASTPYGVFPRTLRPNKALARLQFSTKSENRLELIKQLMLVHFWHEAVMSKLRAEYLCSGGTRVLLKHWEARCLACYGIVVESAQVGSEVIKAQLVPQSVKMSTTVTTTTATPKKKVVTTVQRRPMKKAAPAPKKTQAPKKPAVSYPNDAWFKASIDPENNPPIRLPDQYGNPTAVFKQRLQVTIPYNGPTALGVPRDMVVVANQNPEAGLWVKNGSAPDPDFALKIKPALAQKRHRFLKNAGYAELASEGTLPASQLRRMAIAAKLRMKTLVYSEKRNTKASAAFVLGTQAHLTVETRKTNSAADSYYMAAGQQDSGFITTSSEGHLSTSSPAIVPSVVDEFGQPVELKKNDDATRYGLDCAAGNHIFSLSVDRAGKYAIKLKSSAGVVIASAVLDTTPTGATAFSISIPAVAAGRLFPEIIPQSGNVSLQELHWQAPIPDNEDDWYQIPTPDADTILKVTNGLRCTAQSLLATFLGADLLNQGAGCIALLPADYFQKYTVDDLTMKNLQEIGTQKYDGRASEGFNAFMPPYGAVQSIFQQEDANPYDDVNIAAPRIALVLKGLEPDTAIRLKMCCHLEGPSTSQLFSNRPRGGDPAAYAFCTQALSNVNPCSANFIHMMIVSACLAAWEIAINVAPAIEAVCKFGTIFASSFRTAFLSSKSKKERKEKE